MEGIAPGLQLLPREPVDQVEVDVVETGATGLIDGGRHIFERVGAVQHAQLGRLGRLGAQRQAVDAGAAQPLEVLPTQRARVGLERHLTRIRKVELGAQPFQDSFDPFSRQEGGRASAEKNGVDFGRTRNLGGVVGKEWGHPGELTLDRLGVGRHQALDAGIGVEVAVGASDGTERDVDVDRERHGLGL
jgi:hypothetical protein